MRPRPGGDRTPYMVAAPQARKTGFPQRAKNAIVWNLLENRLIPIQTVPMNIATEMNSEAVLRTTLEVLRHEHRDLDAAIRALQDKGTGDAFTLMRLKRQKLALKDRIAQLADRLTPDIIA